MAYLKQDMHNLLTNFDRFMDEENEAIKRMRRLINNSPYLSNEEKEKYTTMCRDVMTAKLNAILKVQDLKKYMKENNLNEDDLVKSQYRNDDDTIQ